MPEGDVRHVVECRTCEPVDYGYGLQPREWDNACPECADDLARRHILENPDHDVSVFNRTRIPVTVEHLDTAVLNRLFERAPNTQGAV